MVMDKRVQMRNSEDCFTSNGIASPTSLLKNAFDTLEKPENPASSPKSSTNDPSIIPLQIEHQTAEEETNQEPSLKGHFNGVSDADSTVFIDR